MKKAAEMIDGIEISEDKEPSEAPEGDLCKVCKLSSAPKQISRRPISQTFGRYGRIHWDLVQFPPTYNRYQWITHFYVEGIRFHWLYTHEARSQCRDGVRRFIALVKNWWNLPIKAFHYNNEPAANLEIEAVLANLSIVISHSIAYHPEQNGSAERSGGVILRMARHLQIEGQLPSLLWPETDENRWIVPWDEARREFGGQRMKKANLANLRVYGSLTYCRIRQIPKLNKLYPRAEIGFLVGYVASNVWKVWFPARGKIEAVRDAQFDESQKWRPKYMGIICKEIGIQQPTEPAETIMPADTTRNSQDDRNEDIQQIVKDFANPQGVDEQAVEQADRAIKVVESQQIPHTPEPENNEIETELDPASTFPAENTLPGSFPAEESPVMPLSPPEEHDTNQFGPAVAQGVDEQAISEFPTLEACEEEDQPSAPNHPQEDLINPQRDNDLSLSDSEQQLHAELHTRRSDGIDPANIVKGRRTRRTREDPNYIAYATVHEDEEDPPELLRIFAAALYTEKPI
ncbi:hypothetical protein PEBR_22534 [Penicillium brasilianum]|uniref:Retroviral polymerase SH3-like domain-containing protein n=1 Tax=Penicillium brasilianum TaxID=104259 RepID=A0A1S9RL54_PENBI|nr:hypothetical protein PEBR_22534 [Penicillium brasilianum]